MKSFEYGDEIISSKEFMIALPSMVIGVGVLSLPRDIASNTIGSDGWVALIVSGGISLVMIWLMAKLAAKFPRQSFFSYASIIVSKPIAMFISFLFGISYLFVLAYDIRVLGHTSQQYLFDETPVEIITLIFLFVVVYAVSGSRAAIFRLNVLFLPIILFIALFVLTANFKWLDFSNLMPAFNTDLKGHLKAIHASSLSYIGMSIVFFYIAFVDKPKKAPKLAMIGMVIPVGLYILVYSICLLVFGHTATSHLLYPTLDLAKRIELPGGILERVEAVFFVIWTMSVFTTAVMSFDIAILALNSIFKRIKKMQLIFILSPLCYYIGLIPKNTIQLNVFGNILGTYMISFVFIITISLSIIAKIRRVKSNG
ncbi:GerAB/ArcD/ProY family transporter [Lederbergia graminis]|uniref:Endospore germination permease n=1 Tax=Lederbergia graminis TaxID=735518 RepID=A0ABW0LEV4_9BACI